MKNVAFFCIIALSLVIMLSFGQSMLIPLIIALLLCFVTLEINKAIGRITFLSKWLPATLSSLIIIALLLFIGFAIINALIKSLSSLIVSLGNYEPNITSITAQIDDFFAINTQQEVRDFFDSLNVRSILSNIIAMLSSLLSNSLMILIYTLFIFLESGHIRSKINLLFDDPLTKQRFLNIVAKIESSLAQYFKVKTLLSLLTAGLSLIVLYALGVESAVFWAFLIFILNYIPVIGSLIATLFPAFFSLIQFNSFTPFVIIIIGIGAIQQIIGNVLEPKMMGKNLNISPLVAIISLALWGKLWGIIGMLLSVPITVSLIIILSQFHSTKKIAIILSEKGYIE